MSKSCQMCLVPFSKDLGVRESGQYCSYCYSNGKLHGEGMTLKEFKEKSYQGMRESGMGNLKARFFTWLIGFAPYWKGKKG